MEIPQRCCVINNNKIICLKEHKSKFIFHNPEQKKVNCINVDGCAITEGPKCDHLLIDANSVEYFVELKGSDVKHALEQLETSIKKLGGESTSRYAFIISNKCPLIGTDIQNAKKKFKDKYQTTLIIKNTPCEYRHS